MATLVQIVYIACAAQAVFVIALLARRARHDVANRFLIAAVAAIGVSCLYMLYLRTGVYASDPRWLLAIDTLPALYGPLFYLHVRARLGESLGGRRLWLHFLPFVTFTLWDVPRFLLSGADKLALATLEARGLAPVQAFWQWGVELQGLVYFVLCVRLVRGGRGGRWLAFFVWSLLALWLAAMTARATGAPILLYVHIGLTLVIYSIAYVNAAQPAVAAPALPRYQKTGLGAAQAEGIAERMTRLFTDEKPYLDPEFGLATLADRLGVSQHNASQVLNERFGKSFYDWVNGLRVEELKRRLVDDRYAEDKVLTMGLDCGFSSKSALNANFKKWVGMSPTEYRQAHHHQKAAPTSKSQV